MNDPITITEVLGRSEQGMTKPFLCVAEFAEYYVKGAYAGKNSLCCEWVANRLVNLALPSAPLGVPMFRMGDVPRALIGGSGRADRGNIEHRTPNIEHRSEKLARREIKEGRYPIALTMMGPCESGWPRFMGVPWASADGFRRSLGMMPCWGGRRRIEP